MLLEENEHANERYLAKPNEPDPGTQKDRHVSFVKSRL